MQLTQHGVLNKYDGIQPVPPSFGVFQTLGGYASVAARQLALEPSVAGVDRAMSWAFIIKTTNAGLNFKRVFNNGLLTATDTQWNFGVRSVLETGSLNQHCQFSLSTNTTNFLLIQSTKRLLSNRWYFVIVTYSSRTEIISKCSRGHYRHEVHYGYLYWRS